MRNEQYKVKDVAGAEVDRVLVSEATRAMACNKGLGELKAEVQLLKQQKAELSTRRATLQNRLAVLNARVRGQRLSAENYKSICDEQHVVKRLLVEVDAQARQLSQQIESLSDEEYEASGKQKTMATMAADIAEIKSQLGVIIRKLDNCRLI